MSYSTASLTACLPWASPTQRLYAETVMTEGGLMAAARKLGKHHSTIQESIAKLKVRAAAHGVSIEHSINTPVPDPFIVKGQSMLERVDPLTGAREKILEWTKTRIDDERWLEAVKEGVAA